MWVFCAAFDNQVAPVSGAVMSAAKREQVVGLVTPVVFARLNVMYVDEGGMRAPRNATAMLVAA